MVTYLIKLNKASNTFNLNKYMLLTSLDKNVDVSKVDQFHSVLQ